MMLAERVGNLVRQNGIFKITGEPFDGFGGVSYV